MVHRQRLKSSHFGGARAFSPHALRAGEEKVDVIVRNAAAYASSVEAMLAPRLELELELDVELDDPPVSLDRPAE